MKFSDTQLAELGEAIADQMGLHFPAERYRELERGIQSAAAELGFEDADACARWILNSPLTRKQIEILASYLTVGETYFFRDKAGFEALQHFLSELIDSRRGKHETLRLWSAGCCSGEEPYSIAIWLRETFPELRNWSVTILATDINQSFLRKAVTGVYGQWSFRGTPEGLRDRYFKLIGKDQFELSPDIKRMVTFSYLNLVEDNYPSVMNGINAMDVIFCRNVLMYFTPEQTARVAERFYLSLLEGGWLIVSPVEASQITYAQFATLNFPGAICYRKDSSLPQMEEIFPAASAKDPQTSFMPASAQVSLQNSPLHLTEVIEKSPADAPQPTLYQQALTLHESGSYAAATEKLMACLSNEPGNASALALLASTYANQGRLDEARQWCQQAISADRMNAGRYYLLATILQELGQIAEAERALKQALYISPPFVMAHFALGNLAREQGNDQIARKHFANVRSLLSSFQMDAIVPESDGMTAGRLLDIARLLI